MSDRARQLHDSPWQGVLHITGGGAGLLAELLGTPGASRTVLDARVPYSTASLAELLGEAPRQACSADTARALAMAAFQRARQLQASRAFGFALTASLATDRVKRGDCRAHIAVQTATHTFHAEFSAFSDGDDRDVQERELTDAAWRALLAACGLSHADVGGTHRVAAAPEWRALVEGRCDQVAIGEHDGVLLFPGSFNPLHDAHRRMMAHAESRLGRPGAFELSIANPDKPLLNYHDIDRRLAQFEHPVWLTRLPRFTDKARCFPGACFVVGTDTLVRIAHPRYYGDVRERDRQLRQMLERDVTFLVFGRLYGGAFQALNNQQLPSFLLDACTGIDEAEFRMDVSSTEIRNARQPAH